MPERSRKKRPRDVNALASDIVAEARDEKPEEPEQPEQPEKDPSAVELGRRGGLKGGKARAKKLTRSNGARVRGWLRPLAGRSRTATS